MQISLQNLKIYLPSAIINNGTLLLKDNIIESVGTYQKQKSADRIIDLYGYSAIPGYIDTHCHGAMGSDANDGILSGIENMNDYYSTHGITAYYPSLSVDPMPRLIKAFESIREAATKNRHGQIEILGAHFESPFINPKYKGAQAAESICDFTDENFAIVKRFQDIIRRITIAPEMPYNLQRIQELTRMNIVVSGGHSGATYSEVLRAKEEGMTALTHLYNAMSSVSKTGPFRVPGMLEAGLNEESLYAEIIADRIHVPDQMIKIAFRCKGSDKMCLCSDANRGAGMKDGSTIYTCGQEVIIENGIAMLKDRSSLASSVTALDEMVRNLINHVGISPIDAVKMASTNPARMMHIYNRKGSLEAGKDADINIVDEQFNVVMTFFKGVPGYIENSLENKFSSFNKKNN
jgi:N-acetylglucosamine-6-phosphate deacetylase